MESASRFLRLRARYGDWFQSIISEWLSNCLRYRGMFSFLKLELLEITSESHHSLVGLVVY